MTQKTRSLIELNVSILIISGSALFAKLISLDAISIISARMCFAFIGIVVVGLLTKNSFKTRSNKDRLWLLLSGLFLTAHWVTYFLSIQKSTVAIAIISLFTYPIITAIIEPLMHKSRIASKDVYLSLLILIGVGVLAADSSSTGSFEGVLWGVFSALCYALRNIIIKVRLESYTSVTVMSYQLAVGVVLLSPYIYSLIGTTTTDNWVLLVTLALVFTTLAHTLFVVALKKMSAKSASILASLQPVYSTFFAFLILSEVPNWQVYIGGTLIVSAVIIESLSFKKT